MRIARAVNPIGTIRRHPWRFLAAVVLVAASALAAPHLWAWYHFQRAKTCLAQGRTREGQRHLASCQNIWTDSEDVHLMAARAARQAGDFAQAERHFQAMRRLHPDPTPQRSFEWALHSAAAGDLGSNEALLRPKINLSSEEGALACAALAEGYLRNYRGPEALQVLDVWLRRQPDNLLALKLRGDVWRQAEALGKAAECYQRVLELDPAHRAARYWLALCLLEGARPAEALPYWEQLHAESPEDIETQTHLARCRLQLGQKEEARILLEEVLASHPDHVAALQTLGQLCLQEGLLSEAESSLRRALRLAPRDYKINGLLFQVLQQQGRSKEAEAQSERVHLLESHWKHYRKIARDLAEHPQEPELQCELGASLLDLGYDDLGLRWLLSAVNEDPRCRRGHELLAQWYDDHRDADRASYHRRQAQTLPAPSRPQAQSPKP
jgi:predicted Zn-dependent protease